MFDFFRLKQRPVVEDAVPREPSPPEAAKSFDEVLAQQREGKNTSEPAEGHKEAPVTATQSGPVELEKKLTGEPSTESPDPKELPTAADARAKEDQSSLQTEPPLSPQGEPLHAPSGAQQEAQPRPAVQPKEVSTPSSVALEQNAEPGQMDTIKTTKEDVIAAYKIFLGRLPESMEVVMPRVGVPTTALLVDFLASKEFLDQPPRVQLVLALAKRIIDEKKLASANTPAPNQASGPAQPTGERA